MKGHPIIYSEAEMAWLECNRTLPISEYHASFCERFSRADVSAINLHSLRKRKGWRTGRTGCFENGFTPHNKGKKCPPGVGGNHPNARKTQFGKGHLPHNTKFLGHERVSKDGYAEISVDQENPHTGFERRYVLKHRWLWEQKHGPLPEGMALKCLDGDRLNTDPSNWEAVPRAIMPRLNGGRRRSKPVYDEAPVELKPTILAVARLEHAIRERSEARHD
jgi:hypothetical protein